MSGAEGVGAETGLSVRHRVNRAFQWVCWSATWSGLLVLTVLLAGLFWQAGGWLDWGFLTSFDSQLHPERAGLKAGIAGTMWVIGFTALFSVPLGVGAAIYLEEYAVDNWLTRLIRLNLANLAGVPSIVYGILGLTVFVRMFGLFPGYGKVIEVSLGVTTLQFRLPLAKSVLSGALTLTLLILPIVIIASQEALRAVPGSIRSASYALGATQWQTIRRQVLPAAAPGILTGIILSISRAVGETAPLVVIGALTFVPFTPTHAGWTQAPFSDFTTIPIMIFNWITRPQREFQHLAAAGILVLLGILVALNATAIYIRYRFQKNIRW